MARSVLTLIGGPGNLTQLVMSEVPHYYRLPTYEGRELGTYTSDASREVASLTTALYAVRWVGETFNTRHFVGVFERTER